jgi:NAD(P)H-dependent FMN reductase
MSHVIGISGSLRERSFNSALLRAAVALSPPELKIEIASLESIPLYNGDVESAGIPAAVTDLKNRIAAADGLLIATPEYNNSIPGVVKNAIDWLSRPPADIPRVFAGRCVTLMGASDGAFGTALSQAAWLPILRTLQTHPWFGPRILVPHASKVFDERGELIDAKIREKLKSFLLGFSAFVARGRA